VLVIVFKLVKVCIFDNTTEKTVELGDVSDKHHKFYLKTF